jgi:farnesyl diphosphate synthase
MATKDYLGLQRERAQEVVLRLLPSENVPKALAEAMRYAVSTGGKRIRPLLVLTASEAAASDEGDPEAALQAAAAIEYLHSYTLIHDDLPSMDDSSLRRGSPTVHIKYGEALAILAGDALQAHAFDVISQPTKLSPERTNNLVRVLAKAAGPAGVVGGQVEDIANTPLDAERLSYIQLHKTADLFKASMLLGAIAGGGTDDEIEALGHYGEALGVAFQIIDDILDADEENEEPSCLRLWTVEEAREKAKQFTTEAVAALSTIKGSQATAALSDLAEQMLTRII